MKNHVIISLNESNMEGNNNVKIIQKDMIFSKGKVGNILINNF